jgi:hypothetical protein
MLQVSTWFGGVPVNVRLSQFIWTEASALQSRNQNSCAGECTDSLSNTDRIILTPV